MVEDKSQSHSPKGEEFIQTTWQDVNRILLQSAYNQADNDGDEAGLIQTLEGIEYNGKQGVDKRTKKKLIQRAQRKAAQQRDINEILKRRGLT